MPAGLSEPLVVRVLTFNAFVAPGISSHIEERVDLLAAKIAAQNPQLVALQEVWHEDYAARIAEGLAAAGLPNAHWVARRGDPPFGSSGLLTASAFPIERVAFVPYAVGAVPAIAIHADWMANKGVLIVRVETPVGPLDFANTHVHSSYLLHDHLAIRTGQTVELLDALSSTWPAEAESVPRVLAGDLNSTPTSLPFRLLEARGGLVAAGDGFDIDAILIRAGDRTQVTALGSARVLTDPVELPGGERIELSDHPAVQVDLELRSRAPEDVPPRADMQAVTDEAIGFLDAQLSFSLTARIALWALAIVSLAASYRLRRRARQRWRARWRWRALAVVAGVAFVWSVYLAGMFWPHHAEDLAAARAKLTSPAD